MKPVNRSTKKRVYCEVDRRLGSVEVEQKKMCYLDGRLFGVIELLLVVGYENMYINDKQYSLFRHISAMWDS